MFTQQVQLRETDILTVSIVPGSVKVTSLLASEAAASAFLALLPSGTLTVDGHPVLAERPVPGIAEGSGGDDGGASGAGVSASLLGAVIAAAIGGFVLALVLVMFVKRRSSRRSVSPPPPPKYSEATTARSLKALGSPPKYDEARAADQVTYEEAMGGVNEYEYLPDGETLYEIPADGPPQMAKTQHTAQMQRATRTQAHHAQARQVAAPGAQRGATYDMATGYGAGPAAYEAALASDGALYDSATSDEAAVYDTATPGSAAVYDSATPGSAAVYDSATPDNSAAVYDSATPDNSAATYDVASPSARQPEYSVASSARQPAEESYDNLGHDGHTLYDVVPSNRQDQVINFGFRKMSDQDA
ncbi:MAG: hypothetical protein CML43_13835 [Rhodobacteraceae bacterium]|nr:hypothetical protein [Paracoccaceae bacterium]